MSARHWLCEPSAPTTFMTNAVGGRETNHRRLPLDATDLDIADPEVHHSPIAFTRVGEVDEDVGLRIEPHRGTDELLEVDPMRAPPEAELGAGVLVAIAQDPVRDAGRHEGLRDPGFENAGPLGRLDLPTSADVDGDAVDARARQQVGEHQASWTGADHRDRDCGDHVDVRHRHSSWGGPDDPARVDRA